MLNRRTPRRLICGLAAIALLVTLPATASAALKLSTMPDPAAPAGKEAKVVFTLLGSSKGQYYRVTTTQKSGENPLNEQGYPVMCSVAIGRLIYERSPGGRFQMMPSPASYELDSNAPCAGTYEGKVEQRQSGGRPPKVVMTFTLLMPSMSLAKVTTRVR